MSDRANVIYRYDGSFEGLLCCVFESYRQKEIPIGILSPESTQTTFLPVKEIMTDIDKANRVSASIPEKMGPLAGGFVKRAFLTCHSEKELYILLFLRLGYDFGPGVMRMLADEVVNSLYKAVQHLTNEAHLLKGFIRFSVCNGALVSEIEPKNCVLPLLKKHFCERYPQERFLIFDKTHDMALIYQPGFFRIIPIEEFYMPEAGEEELSFRRLWQIFYETIEVPGRFNPKCRMSHMPKRYWKYMTEFVDSQNGAAEAQKQRLLNEPAAELPQACNRRILSE